ncbi:hypothetical protein BSKO_12601 [Bryopsis sp. KO-2023]|nr:hypothetical protein BSKO_12601 [Bryopsis sp. KO-2023]
MFGGIEPAFQRVFGVWGSYVSMGPTRVGLPVALLLLAIGFGVFTLERENDVLNLWVSKRGRIHDEKQFFLDNFEEKTPNLQSFIIRPKKNSGVNLLSAEALAEVEDLEAWVLAYEYEHDVGGTRRNFRLEDFCFKPVDREVQEPCFQYSVLDCFREGNVFTPGGNRNAKYAGIYSPNRFSFRTFDFEESFTDAFVRENCTQWYNLGTADTMFLGGISKGENSRGEPTVSGVEAFRIVFGTKSKERLAKDGAKRITWQSEGFSATTGLDLCQDVSDCGECIEEVGLATASAAGCIPRDVAQTDSCCEFMTGLRESACIDNLFRANAALASLGNIVLGRCGLETVALGELRCDNKEVFLASEDSGPAVCTCLKDTSTSECQTAALAFVKENPEYGATLTAAAGGNETATQEFAGVLVKEAGCPVPEPEVCACLVDSGSTECASGAQAFIDENPKYAATFQDASAGEAKARKELAEILVKEAGCAVEEEVPEVCICLTQSNSTECQTAGAAFIGESPEFAAAFGGAAAGDEDSVKEVGRILVEEVGCPTGDGGKTAVPEVCTCLIDSSSDECAAAGLAFATENPEYQPAFLGASTGDADAIQEVARILTVDLECPTAGEKKRMRKILQAEEEDELPAICTCLKDSDTKACSDAGAAFVAKNPKFAPAFAQAAGGNVSAQAEVGAIIATEGPCGVEKFSFEVETTSFKDEDEAWDLLHGWEKAWRSNVGEKVKEYKFIEVSWITSSTLDDENENAAKAQAPLMIVGYVLVLLYMILYFSLSYEGGKIKISTMPPGPFSAIMGFFSILLGVFTTFGIIGVVSISSLKTSALTLQIVPLLMVGLGINDFFVLASYMKSAVQKYPMGPVPMVMYETMAGGGTSITLSSTANTVAFALGALSPIPAVQWFSIHMMIGIVVAYVISITVIPSILTSAASRWLGGDADIFLPRVGKPSKVEPSANPQGGKFSFPWYLFSGVVFGVFFAWLGISIWGITQLDLGLSVSKSVPDGKDTYRYLMPSEEYFQTFPVYVVFKGGSNSNEVDVYKQSRDVEFEFVDKAYKMDRGYKSTSWLNYYSDYVASQFCSNDICMAEVDWFFDSFSSKEFGDPIKDVCAGLTSKKACKKACDERCPQGPVGSEFRCSLSDEGTSCYCPYRPILKKEYFFESPEDFKGKESYWVDFLNTTNTGSISRSLINFDETSITERNTFGVPAGFRTLTFVEEVTTVDEKLKHLDSGRGIIDNGPIDGAYPFDLIVYGVGEQYKDLGTKTTIAVAISIGVALLVMMPLIVYWLAAVIVIACVLSAVVITAGTAHWADMNLNYSLYVSLIVAVGLSVEFCAHIARDFMLSTGTNGQRVGHAIQTVGFAVFNGGLTTFLGVLPVAWAEFNYFQVYFFALYSLVVGVGVFVGLFVLPAVLFWMGPAARNPPPPVSMPDSKTVEMAKV